MCDRRLIVKRFFFLVFVGTLFSNFAGAVELEPVLQDISPGWQSLKGEQFTYINRGEFIDIYDNKSRVLFRSIQVSMDEGAGKGSAYRFAVSADEKYVQATLWVKQIGDYLATYEVATGNPVEMAAITARESGGSANDFNNDPSLLPPGLEPRSVSHFASAPERFLDRSSFLVWEKIQDRDLRQVDVSLLRCDRQEARSDASESLRSSPSVSVDERAASGQPIRSFPLTEILTLAQQGVVTGATGLDPSATDGMEVLCAVDRNGAPQVVVSSAYEVSQVYARDVIVRASGGDCALTWDVFPGKPSLLNGIEVRSLSDGALKYRDESTWAECLSFSREPEVLYVVARFGHERGPLSTIKDRVLAKVRMTQAGTELIWQRPVGPMIDLSVEPEESWIYTVSDDGRLHVFDAMSGTELVNVAGYEENALLVSNSEHFFMASGGASDAIALRRGERAYPLEQFDLHFNRPHLLLEQLGASATEIESARITYADRLLLHGLTETSLSGFENLPEINGTIGSQEGSRLKLVIDARSADSDLVSLSAWVNNVPIFGKAGGMTSGRQVAGEFEIPVLDGVNRIQLSVMDALGRESIKETLLYQSRGQAPPPVARILTIGVSDYPGTDFDLEFAAKDAQDLLAALSGSLGGKMEVKTRVLVDGDATKAGIVAAKSFFAEGNPDDLAIVFLAGHGVLNEGDNRYYYCPADIDFEDFARNGVSYEEIENLVDEIPAMKRVILIDSCHSGELTEKEMRAVQESAGAAAGKEGGQVRSIRVIGSRAPGETVSKREMRDSHFAFQDFRRQVGAQVLSSAGPLELAFEGAEYKNGLFTFYLLSALRGQTADRNKDGALTVAELFTTTAKEVVEATEGLQHPRFRHENTAFDFPLIGTPADSSGVTLSNFLPGFGFEKLLPAIEKARAATAPQVDMKGRRFPDLSRRLLSDEDTAALSLDQIRYAINELYGVYGYPFENASASAIRKHFSQFSWFRPESGLTMETIDTRMSPTEKQNIVILAKARAERQ
jgi:uncharacterized caspase-like protein